jgi:hypothetical protein
VPDEEITSITRAVDELAVGQADPLEALRELARRYGVERVGREARIAIGSWRSRIELVADALEQMLGEGGTP